MKKTLLVLLFGLIFFMAQAQVRLGAFIGVHSANVIETNHLSDWQTTTKPYLSSRTGIQLGVIGDIPLGQKGFYFQPGIYYSAKGRQYNRNYDTANMVADSLYPVYQKSSLNLGYIEIPLNIAYKVFFTRSHKSSFFVSVGPYFAFMYSSKMPNQSLSAKWINDTTESFNYSNTTDDLPIGNGVNKYKTFDFGINGRAGFELGSVILSAYGSRGLTNFYDATYSGTFYHQLFGASLGIWIAKTQPTTPVKSKPKDTDKDGITDDIDLCPKVPGIAKYNGCPVPDTDGDGIDDEHDSCKTIPGVAKYNGCPVPDSDNDGIDDEHDSCRTVAGIAKYNGCPIPDTDGDGINDEEDKCPTVAGVKENNGCPAIKKEIKEKVNYVSHNILFATASDKLTPGSYLGLNDLYVLLTKHPELVLHIEGYTDTVGTPERNLVLSQKRADAVKNYLLAKGIPESRIIAVGHGQDNPVEDNSTEKGRTANRRVELKLTSQ